MFPSALGRAPATPFDALGGAVFFKLRRRRFNALAGAWVLLADSLVPQPAAGPLLDQPQLRGRVSLFLRAAALVFDGHGSWGSHVEFFFLNTQAF